MLFDIDFDFFVRETKSHDFGYIENPFFMDDIWSIRFTSGYSHPYNPYDLTKEMILDYDSLEKVFSFVEKCKIENWAVSESHLFAYKYIDTLIKDQNCLGIVHIDRHSDLDLIDKRLHAGNWLRHVVQVHIKNLDEIYWINRNSFKNESRILYDRKEVMKLVEIKDISFLEMLDPSKIHNLFLCKSSAWVPPWFDKTFFSIQRKLEKLFGKPEFYDPIPKIREWNYDKMVKVAIEERKNICSICRTIEKDKDI